LIHIYIIIYWAMGPNKRKCVCFLIALSFVIIVVVMMIGMCVLLPSLLLLLLSTQLPS
jgi:hypothetical protein